MIVNTAAVKDKVIFEYNYLISRLELGYKPEYDHILNMILFIETYNLLDNKNVIFKKILNE